MLILVFIYWLYKFLVTVFFIKLRKFYYPNYRNEKIQFLQNEFKHIVIGESIKNIKLYPLAKKHKSLLIKNPEKKIIHDIVITTPIIKKWARWFENNMGVSESFNSLSSISNELLDNFIRDENIDGKKFSDFNYWKVHIVLSFRYQQILVLYISDDDLEIKMNINSSKEITKIEEKSESKIIAHKTSYISKQPTSLFVDFSKKEAISELKKQKELLELDLINKKEFDKIKGQLKLIIVDDGNVANNYFSSLFNFFRKYYLIIIIIILSIVFLLSLFDISIIDFFDEKPKKRKPVLTL